MPSDFDFADLFTQAVREELPRLQAKGLDFLFDYRGSLLRWQGDSHRVRCAMQRVFQAAVDMLDDGFVFFTAQAAVLPSGDCGLAVAAACSGFFAPTATWRSVLGGLHLQGVDGMTDEALLEMRMPLHAECELTAGRLKFVVHETEGALFALEVTLPQQQFHVIPDDGVYAGGARAWLINGRGAARSLERRLQRLGWATRQFDSMDDAIGALQRLSARHSRPALVLAYEGPGTTPGRLEHLGELLPPASRVVLAVQPGSDASSRFPPGTDMHTCPFGPAELRDFTREAAQADLRASGETRPAPLAFEQRKRALVVDDNAVNQMVACGMLQVLGFEVDIASDGLEAIDRCMQLAPDLVLMDLHMPGMDGLEATRRLRLLQREGAMPRFPILAATADSTSQEACAAAGMDGHLPKPLNLAGLETQLRSLMTG